MKGSDYIIISINATAKRTHEIVNVGSSWDRFRADLIEKVKTFTTEAAVTVDGDRLVHLGFVEVLSPLQLQLLPYTLGHNMFFAQFFDRGL